MAKMKEPESMEECKTFSRRVLDDGTKLVLWVPVNTPTVMNINYTCIKCGKTDSITDEYGLPYVIVCSNCGEKIKVTPLKGKKKGAKKAAAKEKAAKRRALKNKQI